MDQLSKINWKFIDTVEDPTEDFFIKEYEEKSRPAIITSKLNWKAFKWEDEYVAKVIGREWFVKYLNSEASFFTRKKTELPERIDVDTIRLDGNSLYLYDIPLAGTKLQEDYEIPDLFKKAHNQPAEWQWLFWGPPSTGTHLHCDVGDSHAWNVCLYGNKIWWYFYNGEWHNAITQPGDIIYTPPKTPHAAINLTKTMAITHNYHRTYEEYLEDKRHGTNYVKY